MTLKESSSSKFHFQNNIRFAGVVVLMIGLAAPMQSAFSASRLSDPEMASVIGRNVGVQALCAITYTMAHYAPWTKAATTYAGEVFPTL